MLTTCVVLTSNLWKATEINHGSMIDPNSKKIYKLKNISLVCDPARYILYWLNQESAYSSIKTISSPLHDEFEIFPKNPATCRSSANLPSPTRATFYSRKFTVFSSFTGAAPPDHLCLKKLIIPSSLC